MIDKSNEVIIKTKKPVKKSNRLFVKSHAPKEIKQETPNYKPMKYDYKKRKIEKKIERGRNEFFKMFSDREITILLLWALIGPFCALAYIVWIKYPRLRMLSVLFFFLNIFYFVGQLGGWLYILPKTTNILGFLF